MQNVSEWLIKRNSEILFCSKVVSFCASNCWENDKNVHLTCSAALDVQLDYGVSLKLVVNVH